MPFSTTDVIERAAGHLSIRNEGRELSAFEGEVLLSYLNDIFACANAFTGGVDYRDIEVQSSHRLRRQDRALVIGGGSITLHLPPAPIDGMKVNIVDVGAGFGSRPVIIDRNDRLIDGAANNSLLNVDGANVVYTYREDSSSWQMLNTVMALGSNVPLPQEFLGHLGAWVAVEAWEEFRGGQQAGPRLIDRADEGQRCIRARFAPDMTAQLDPFFAYDHHAIESGSYSDIGGYGILSSGSSSGGLVPLDPNGPLSPNDPDTAPFTPS